MIVSLVWSVIGMLVERGSSSSSSLTRMGTCSDSRLLSVNASSSNRLNMGPVHLARTRASLSEGCGSAIACGLCTWDGAARTPRAVAPVSGCGGQSH